MSKTLILTFVYLALPYSKGWARSGTLPWPGEVGDRIAVFQKSTPANTRWSPIVVCESPSTHWTIPDCSKEYLYRWLPGMTELWKAEVGMQPTWKEYYYRDISQRRIAFALERPFDFSRMHVVIYAVDWINKQHRDTLAKLKGLRTSCFSKVHMDRFRSRLELPLVGDPLSRVASDWSAGWSIEGSLF